MLVLVGLAILVAGFLAGLNPLLIVVAAALASGLAAGLGPVAVISAFGKAFNDNRFVSLVWLVLPTIGLLERAGLQERARQLLAGQRRLSPGRILGLYFVVRQVSAALGLTGLGGQAQMVRPLIAPMTEAAAEARRPGLEERLRRRLRAHAAAVDNIAVFFGEDIFIAMASILLIRAFLKESGVDIEPLRLSVWAIPTALGALVVHGFRLWRLDRSVRPPPEEAP